MECVMDLGLVGRMILYSGFSDLEMGVVSAFLVSLTVSGYGEVAFVISVVCGSAGGFISLPRRVSSRSMCFCRSAISSSRVRKTVLRSPLQRASFRF